MARVGSQPFDKLDIPIVMKVARVQPRGGDKLLVSAGIVVVGCVEGLVQVANEVQQELQRHEVLGRDGGRIAELGRELIDLVNHAGLRRAFRCRNPWRERRMAETSRDKIRLRQFDIHKVPPPCRFVPDLGPVAIAVPILVGPCRLAGDVVCGQSGSVGSEKCGDLESAQPGRGIARR